MGQGEARMIEGKRSTNEVEWARAEAVTPGGVHTSLRNVEPHAAFARAQGAYIWDVEGNRYTDYHCAFSPIILGHCHPEVLRRATEAARESDLFGVGITDHEIQLCAKIVEHVPSAEKVLLCNSGSEATYHALRVARAVTGREKVIKFQGCYHGWHDYVLRNAVSAADQVYKRDPGSTGMLDAAIDATLVCRLNDLDDVRSQFDAHPSQIAAVIIEPVVHTIGCLMPEPGFLEGLRSLCDRFGAVLVFDEVVTGFRHSLGGYQQICGVTPDLTTMGKAMANGYPMAAVAGKRSLMDRFNTRSGGDVFFAGTFNGGTLTSAAALATIDIMETEPVHEHIFRLGDRMRSGLSDIVDRLSVRAQVAGYGSVFTLYFFDAPYRTYEDLLQNPADLYVDYRKGMIRRGVWEIPMNLKRNVITYSHTDADIDATLEAAEDTLKELRLHGRV
jgi:glutamate-1-semialdehyde 2,1-aminomutase